MENIINKTMDKHDLNSTAAKKIISELNSLIELLYNRGLRISSWYGLFDLSGDENSNEVLNRGVDYCPLPIATDDVNFPWFLYWEIIWLVQNNNFKVGQHILDMGGSSSLFSYYLASKGIRVTTIDLNECLVENAIITTKAMSWSMDNIVMDIMHMKFDEQFDHITSVCVYEHIPVYKRIEINQNIKKILKKGGSFSITFDYKNPSIDARINSPDDVKIQFLEPSGMTVRGNWPIFDCGKSYLFHPSTRSWYTFGALFMEKT